MLSKEGEIRRDEACFDYSGKEVLSFFSDFFYRTRVRSLSILVSNSLTHSEPSRAEKGTPPLQYWGQSRILLATLYLL